MGKVNITIGKKVLEVRPVVDWNKGKAIRLIIEKFGKGKKYEILPVYIGDDQTDEDAFTEINKHNDGISVLVGDNQTTTGARYFLKSTPEVVQFLNSLFEIGEGISQ